GLFGRDPLIGRLAVDLACRRSEPDARAMAEVFFEVALEALLAAVFEQWHIDNLSLQALAPSGERVGRGGCHSHRRSPSRFRRSPLSRSGERAVVQNIPLSLRVVPGSGTGCMTSQCSRI